MTSFDDRKRGEEAKFAHDEETAFRIQARRNRLLGLWAGDLMGLSAIEAEAYAKEVVKADFEEPGSEDVVRKLMGDILGAGLAIDEDAVRAMIEAKQAEAQALIMGEG